MKKQYLGDSKDSFKWDYHDFLTSSIGYPLLNVALMMTPDDDGNHGQTDPALFPGRAEVIKFCRSLRKNRCVRDIKSLPGETGNSYKVDLHNSCKHFTNRGRLGYFSGLRNSENQVLLLDPDNGFEPINRSKEHVSYEDIVRVTKQINDASIVSVFQCFRRVPFREDYANIKRALEERDLRFSTTVCWDSNMFFVQIAKSKAILDKIRRINEQYCAGRDGVTVL